MTPLHSAVTVANVESQRKDVKMFSCDDVAIQGFTVQYIPDVLLLDVLNVTGHRIQLWKK